MGDVRSSAATALTIVLCELGDFAMMRKMLLGIKERAELRASVAVAPVLTADRESAD